MNPAPTDPFLFCRAPYDEWPSISTTSEPAMRTSTVEDRLAALEEDVAFLRRILIQSSIDGGEGDNCGTGEGRSEDPKLSDGFVKMIKDMFKEEEGSHDGGANGKDRCGDEFFMNLWEGMEAERKDVRVVLREVVDEKGDSTQELNDRSVERASNFDQGHSVREKAVHDDDTKWLRLTPDPRPIDTVTPQHDRKQNDQTPDGRGDEDDMSSSVTAPRPVWISYDSRCVNKAVAELKKHTHTDWMVEKPETEWNEKDVEMIISETCVYIHTLQELLRSMITD